MYLALSQIYQQYGFAFGQAESIGDGLPSRAAANTLGFYWPVGSVIVKDGHHWSIGADSVTQLD